MPVYGSKCACALLNHTHKFTFMNQIGKILSRRTRETIHQIGVALCSGKWSLPVMLIVDLSLARVVQHSPFPVLCLAYTRVVSQIDGAVRAHAHAYDDHYLTRSKFNSLLTEMITPQTYIYIYM